MSYQVCRLLEFSTLNLACSMQGKNMSVMNANMNIQIDKAEMPDIYKVSEAEIRPLAEELYLGTNCEPAHDADNWKCAQYILEQKRRVQIEIEKAARQGHF